MQHRQTKGAPCRSGAPPVPTASAGRSSPLAAAPWLQLLHPRSSPPRDACSEGVSKPIRSISTTYIWGVWRPRRPILLLSCTLRAVMDWRPLLPAMMELLLMATRPERAAPQQPGARSRGCSGHTGTSERGRRSSRALLRGWDSFQNPRVLLREKQPRQGNGARQTQPLPGGRARRTARPSHPLTSRPRLPFSGPAPAS